MVRAPKAAGAMVSKAVGAMVQKAAGAMAPKAGAMVVKAGDMLLLVMVAKAEQTTILFVHRPDQSELGLTKLSSRTTSSSSSPRRSMTEYRGWWSQ